MTLSLHKITLRYGPVTAVAGASADLPAGQVSVLIGPNGAGKSSVLKAAAGLLPATGQVTLAGAPAGAGRGGIVYMPQDNAAATSLSLIELVLLGRLDSLSWAVPRATVAAAIDQLAGFGLADLAERGLDAVSGGQRQLAFLAQALFREPRVLLLDEPTAALDVRHQLTVLDLLRRTARDQGIVVAAALHDLSLAAIYANHVVCLADGRVDAAGPVAEVLTAARLRRVYGVEAELTRGADGRPRVTPLRAV